MEKIIQLKTNMFNIHKKDNKWYWMDTCKELKLKKLADE